ncbi:tetratricopeptide repeat protein [Streptomyces hirsutus]|uniref:tetratricopeptide repeat protein n=1 Tax=Streptomyces hirsutus TaxID=35620 RepID=UPI0006E2ABBE|nr:tetratricopeptide repeat protein [Streptomyces hirsutus]
MAGRLDDGLRNPSRGACEAALGAERAMLLDASLPVTYAAVAEAAQRAARARGLLILSWIGHGMTRNGDFYVLPQGSVPRPGDPVHPPYGLAQHLKELLAELPGLEMILLIDACFSGDGAVQAVAAWAGLDGDARRRFQVLTASSAGEPAWDCAFTAAVAALLDTGDITAGDHLDTADLKRALERATRKQQPVLALWDGANGLGPWVAHNAALLQQAGSPLAFATADLPAIRAALRHFRLPAALAQVAAASAEHRCVVVRGAAGYGKTTLLAALCRPEVTAGAVPDRFVHAFRSLRLHESSTRLARDLANQLQVTVPEFRAAQEEFRSYLPVVTWEAQPVAEQVLLGALRVLPAGTPVRIVLDGFDQLSDASAVDVGDLVRQLRETSNRRWVPPDLRLVISSRPGGAPPADGPEIQLDAAADEEIRAYLRAQHVGEPLVDPATRASAGSWLVTSLLADYIRTGPGLAPGDVPTGLAAVYERIFDAGLDGGGLWAEDGSIERVVFTVLAAAGAGAVLPEPLLLRACAEMGAPEVTPAWLRTRIPAQLRRFIVRAPAGEGDAVTVLWGLFHQSLAEFLGRSDSPYAVDLAAGHRAAADAITAIAPAQDRTPVTARQPLQEYAERAEAGHLWRCGEYGKALESLVARPSVVPADNLHRWATWSEEAQRTLGAEHEETLGARHHLALWTSHAGDTRESLHLLKALLADQQRMGAPDDPSTLVTRVSLVNLTLRVGDARRALEMSSTLLADQARVLGPSHRLSLATRQIIAICTATLGDPARAVRLLTELLHDQEQALGPDDPDTLTTRNSIASWSGVAGDRALALEVATLLLPDRERVLGADHFSTLATRHNIAQWTAELGDVAAGLRLNTELLADRVRVLGPDHPDTLATRHNIAECTGRNGDVVAALRELTELLPDRIRVLGADHPDTLITRDNIAGWTARSGDTAQALWLFADLLPDATRVLGPAHTSVFHIRRAMATLTGELGGAAEAVRLLTVLLADQVRNLGSLHKETLRTRASLAEWSASSGDLPGALRFSAQLLPDLDRVFGPDEPETLDARLTAVAWTGEAGDPRRALLLAQELLADQVRLFGADAPRNFPVQVQVAVWTKLVHGSRAALPLWIKLLPEAIRQHGRSSSTTRMIREHIVKSK